MRGREREREQRREDLFIRCLAVYLFIGLLFGQRAVDAQFLESFSGQCAVPEPPDTQNPEACRRPLAVQLLGAPRDEGGTGKPRAVE